MGSRGSEDEKWQLLKKEISLRDKWCQLSKTLTPTEFLLMKRNAGNRLSVLDPAHVFGAGPFPHMKYLKENVVLLNRYAHDCLDYFKDPISGSPIDKEKHTDWWIRIVGKARYEKLLIMSRQGDFNGSESSD